MDQHLVDQWVLRLVMQAGVALATQCALSIRWLTCTVPGASFGTTTTFHAKSSSSSASSSRFVSTSASCVASHSRCSSVSPTPLPRASPPS